MDIKPTKGRKIGKNECYPDGPSKGDTVYPLFSIDIVELPEAKDWKIGQEYEITLRIRQTGLSVYKNESRKEDYGSASFEITGIGIHGEAKNKRYSRIKK